MMYSKVVILLVIFVIAEQCLCARILSVIPFPGKSHFINIQPILYELSARGHQVTLITTNYEPNPPPNYNQIIVDKKTLWESFGKNVDVFSIEQMSFVKELPFLWNGIYKSIDTAFNSTNLRDFIKNDKSHFDLIITELFFHESFYLFAHKYKAPMIGINTMGFAQYISDFMGNPSQLAYMPHEFLPVVGEMGLWKRMVNTLYKTYEIFMRKYYLMPMHEEMAEKYFGGFVPKPWPSIEEIERNMSLVLINTHYSMDIVRPHVPGIVEIGGVHIGGKVDPLPDDLQKFLDGSKNGVIYFSMGSNIKSKDLPKEKVEMFLKVFSKLKQDVLWKWEDTEMPGKPKNVFIKSWLPQFAVLDHPNVKCFMTHGGLLSTIESVHFGKPILAMPIYGDQHLNAAKAETLGFGIKVIFSKLSEASLEEALGKLLGQPSYWNKARELSTRFRDRPLSPMDTAIYWIEYVIRHKGAPFMRSKALDLSWYQLALLDVIALLLIGVLVVFYVVRSLFRKLFCECGGKYKKD